MQAASLGDRKSVVVSHYEVLNIGRVARCRVERADVGEWSGSPTVAPAACAPDPHFVIGRLSDAEGAERCIDPGGRLQRQECRRLNTGNSTLLAALAKEIISGNEHLPGSGQEERVLETSCDL